MNLGLVSFVGFQNSITVGEIMDISWTEEVSYGSVTHKDSLNLLSVNSSDLEISMKAGRAPSSRMASDSAIQDESNVSKLSRSGKLLADGAASGALERIDTLLSNPTEGAGLFIGALALGYSLTAMSESGGKLGVVAKTANYLLKAGVALDLANRGMAAAPAFADNWKSDHNYEANKTIVERTVGSAITDYSLMATGGIAGVSVLRAMPRVSVSLSVQSQKPVLNSENSKITSAHYAWKYDNAFYDGKKIHFHSAQTGKPSLLTGSDQSPVRNAISILPVLPTSLLDQMEK